MSKRKNIISKIGDVSDLEKLIAETVAGLNYMSETDAEIIVFKGQQTDSITKENFSLQINKSNKIVIEEQDFNEFFKPLIKTQKWFGEEEQKQTEKFIILKKLLQENLINKKVFRLGKKDIDIYVVGLDKDNILRGIQTKSVET